MILNLKFRDRLYQIGSWFVQEMDGILTAIRSAWDVEHNDDGTHGDIHATSLTITKLTPQDIAQGKGTGNVTADGAGPHTFAQWLKVIATQTVGAAVNAFASIDISVVAGSAYTPSFINIMIRWLDDATGFSRWGLTTRFDGGADYQFMIVDSAQTGSPLVLRRFGGVDYFLQPGKEFRTTKTATVNLGNPNDSFAGSWWDNLYALHHYSKTGIMGEWTTFTPAWSNLTVGNGSSTGRYCQLVDMAVVEMAVVFGTTTTVGGNIGFNFPINNVVAGSIQSFGVTDYYDSSAGFTYPGFVQPTAAATGVLLSLQPIGGSIGHAGVSAAFPFVWATGDQIFVLMYYRTA